MTSPVASTSKEEWRAQFRTYRRSLNSAAYAARSGLIVHRTLGLPVVADAQVVHCYWPLSDRGEVDTRPLIAGLRSRDTEVVLPVITSFDPAQPTLEHRRYAGPGALETNRWGVCEPTHTDTIAPDALDLVLVPALGADHNGTRIGQGAGYYDAFLESVACPCIALVYEACITASLPSTAHDVPMTMIVSEDDIYPVAD
ncbi:MAG: 5-formyltetrahydrofolate cyclo-ligase [Salinibacter sp.]|uniref:5-formyltetrahydrofolate cyclo-ligase n=1 Tax=Salinibacter sp. TaxID=2065818 RepID=UPI0035D457DC